MTIIIFLIVLAVLILVHEFGHFIIAKKNDIRVDEFGLGFPPKVAGYQPEGSETEYTLNWIPFGGFVKIFGENYSEEALAGEESERSFINKPKWVQAAVLSGGVLFNILFAWFLFSVGFASGMPTAVQDTQTQAIDDPQIVITDVQDTSPAEEAGLVVGDVITRLSNDEALQGERLSVDSIQEFIGTHPNTPLTITVQRENTREELSVTPKEGVVEGQPGIGIAMSTVGVLRLPPHKAIYRGFTFTLERTRDVAVGVVGFLKRVVTGQANYSQVAGPVGIAGLVGDATSLGFIHLLTFTAFISLNLAILNLLPFPALDGGRLVFVLVEKIKGTRIKPQVANILNTIGFVLLILLMIVITYHDIVRLF